MSSAVQTEAAPFDSVRDLAAKVPAGDMDAAEKVRDALLVVGRAGDFGQLEKAAIWLATWQKQFPPRIEKPRLAIFAGAHGLTKHGVSLSSDADTHAHIAGLRAGTAPLACIAAQNKAEIKIFELAVDKPTPNIATEPAMTERECAATIAYGFEAVAEKPDILALGVMGAGIGTAAAAIACALYGGTVDYWVRPGPGTPSDVSANRIKLVEEALELHQGKLEGPLDILCCLGGREIAACVGAILAARHEGIPVLLDGFATTIAAGVIHAMNPEAIDHVLAAHVTRRPAHEASLERLGLTPLMDLEFQTGGGLGSTTALGLLETACAPFTV